MGLGKIIEFVSHDYSKNVLVVCICNTNELFETTSASSAMEITGSDITFRHLDSWLVIEESKFPI